jgi:hypothetical protein
LDALVSRRDCSRHLSSSRRDPAQQYAFRLRAERLQNDINSLQYGGSASAQVQAILRRWNATYKPDGSCRQDKCSGEITIGDFAYAHSAFFSNHQRLFGVYGSLGGRPAMVAASSTLEDGVVHSKSYAAYVEVFPNESVAIGLSPYGYSLIGENDDNRKLAAEIRQISGWIRAPGLQDRVAERLRDLRHDLRAFHGGGFP